MLWIALHLPLLSLESFAATLASAGKPAADPPLALMDAQRIVSANAVAQALGVKPGLKRATALALVPQLTLGRADFNRDAQALQPVAHAALAFTPMVAIQPPDGASARPSGGGDASASQDGVKRPGCLIDADAAAHTVLLEVEASLRYFGGHQRLLQRLHAALRPLNHRIHTVSAPTAQAAALLARVHPRLHCADIAAARTALDAAPVWLLGPGQEHWGALQGMGLRTLGDLAHLPRAGLGRRFGQNLLGELDRAYGTAPDPRVAIGLPPVFESRLELFARADTTEQVLHGAAILLTRLVMWLAAQHGFVRRFTLSMQHEARSLRSSDGPRATVLELALAEPSRDSAHLLVLLRERLAHVQLPAPTLDLLLQADDVVHRAAPNQELFATSRNEREGLIQLIERLQARLGPDQVQRLQPVEDHRPECAGRIEAATSKALLGGATAKAKTRLKAAVEGPAPVAMKPLRPKPGASPSAKRTAAAASAHSGRPMPRPVWLLQKPEPLPERQSRPLLEGKPLQLLSGPERIEAGWWDAGLAERDYFIAQADDGALVWIYRARLPLSASEEAQGWFMQGRFG